MSGGARLAALVVAVVLAVFGAVAAAEPGGVATPPTAIEAEFRAPLQQVVIEGFDEPATFHGWGVADRDGRVRGHAQLTVGETTFRFRFVELVDVIVDFDGTSTGLVVGGRVLSADAAGTSELAFEMAIQTANAATPDSLAWDISSASITMASFDAESNISFDPLG